VGLGQAEGRGGSHRRVVSGLSAQFNVLGASFRDVHQEYEVESGEEGCLGCGQFGVTRAARHRTTGQRVACKSILKAKLQVCHPPPETVVVLPGGSQQHSPGSRVAWMYLLTFGSVFPILALLQSKGDVEDIRREVCVMKLLGAHPSIAQFHDAFEDSDVSTLLLTITGVHFHQKCFDSVDTCILHTVYYIQ